ncbi:RHS repeat-associated core domain-containing protein [Pseudomonas sp. 10-1B]|uniref:RHS repeat-associated core domain-containing protein n=1 Tax=Pseudomonas sp. 10-1B TaxID=1546029 RepID=UPI0009E5813B|nr:RHS repeat-associated core domain-containing protein [Pseudomonas sp. 10-1B]
MEHLRLLATDRQHSVINDSAHGFRAYTAYGLAADQGGPTSAFCGEPKDALTGCYHLGNGYRQFNTVIMRFNSADSLSPFGKGGLNAYMYCAGDPVNRRDPSGAAPVRTSFKTALPTTTRSTPISPVVAAVAGHVQNGGVLVLNIAGAALSLVLPVPTSKAGIFANGLAVGGGLTNVIATGLKYTKFASQAGLVGAFATDVVALSLGIKAGLAVKAAGPRVLSNAKANMKAIFTSWLHKKREPISLELTEGEMTSFQERVNDPQVNPSVSSSSTSISNKSIRSG